MLSSPLGANGASGQKGDGDHPDRDDEQPGCRRRWPCGQFGATWRQCYGTVGLCPRTNAKAHRIAQGNCARLVASCSTLERSECGVSVNCGKRKSPGTFLA